MAGMEMGMFMSGASGRGGGMRQEMRMKMVLAPRLRTKPLPKKKRRKLFQFTGRTARPNEVHHDDRNDAAAPLV